MARFGNTDTPASEGQAGDSHASSTHVENPLVLQSSTAALTRTDVLAAAAVLFVLDVVADKIPYVDSLWDTVHTAIRPTIGAILGVLIAGDASTPEQAFLAVTGGTSALVSHLVKAGLRALA